MTSWWGRKHLKSPAPPLFNQPFIETQIKENFKIPRHWPETGELPVQMARNAENVSIWWRHHVYASVILFLACSCETYGSESSLRILEQFYHFNPNKARVSAGSVINPMINMLHIKLTGLLMTSTDIHLKHIACVLKLMLVLGNTVLWSTRLIIEAGTWPNDNNSYLPGNTFR